MCYNTRQSRKKKELQKWAHVDTLIGNIPDDFELIYFSVSGFSHPIMWTITQENPKALSPNMWGIMPPDQAQARFKEYFKNPKTFGGLNAQSEKLFDHFIYRNTWQHQRCLIPVDGFFEPHNTKVKVKGKDFKVPFYFKRKDGDPLFLAGIYTKTADGRRTFSVLTKAATPRFAEIHNDKKRRPVIMDYDQKDAWLQGGLDKNGVKGLIARDLWEGALEAHPVTRELYSRITNPNRPDIIDTVHYEQIGIAYGGKPNIGLFD